jgi:hypothetical protein
MLTTLPHLVPWPRMSRSYISSPHCSLHGRNETFILLPLISVLSQYMNFERLRSSLKNRFMTHLTHSIPALLGPVYLNAHPCVFNSQGRLKHSLGNKTHILRGISFNLWQIET